jgi:hypothetical protein
VEERSRDGGTVILFLNVPIQCVPPHFMLTLQSIRHALLYIACGIDVEYDVLHTTYERTDNGSCCVA